MTTIQKNILAVILIVIVGFAVYGNALNGEFIWDDEHLIKNNPNVKSWVHLPRVFTEDIGVRAGRRYNFYRPVQMMTYMADYSLWKLNVKGYHLTNIILHILVALCIYYLVSVLFNDQLLSLLTGIFYVVHPVHTEAVTYISGRADSLALLFMLSCFIFYVGSCSKKSLGRYACICLSYTLALLSKEGSLILPALLLLYHYNFRKKINVKEFLSIAGLAVIYVVLRLTVLRDLLSEEGYASSTFLQRLPGTFVAFANYIKLLFLPFGLHMEYGKAIFEWRNPGAILGAAMLVMLLIFGLRKKEKGSLVFFAVFWFLITFLPVSNLYPINAYMAEHWLYLPSIGFFLILAKMICRGVYCNTPLCRSLTIIFAIGLLGFYSYLTFRQNIYWREPISFFERTLKYAPNSEDVYYNLGTTYVDFNRKEDAVTAFKKAVELKPNYAMAYNNLGNVYNEMNRKKEAIDSYKNAVKNKPDFALAYYNLGVAYQGMNNIEKAMEAYKKAIEIDHNYAEAHNNLGVIHAALNRKEEAIASYTKAVEIDPDYADAHFSLGNVYRAMGKGEEAVEAYTKATQINPADAEAYYNIGMVSLQMNKQKEAAAAFREAIRINPVYNNPQTQAILKNKP